MKITFDVDIYGDYFKINGAEQSIKDCSYPWSCLSRSLEGYIFLALLFALTAHLIKTYSGAMKLNTPYSIP